MNPGGFRAQKRKRPLGSGRLLRLPALGGQGPFEGDPGDVRPGDSQGAELAVALTGQIPQNIGAFPPGPQKTNNMNEHIQAFFLAASKFSVELRRIFVGGVDLS
jgi:hypothetical protein